MSQDRQSTPASRQRGGYSDLDERAMLDAIGRWVEREVKPQVMEMEHDDVYPHAFVEQMKEFGLFGATVSERYGGLGLRAATYARIVSLISEQWMSLTGIFNSHLMMATIVEKHGTEAQREYWLPKFVTGEIRGGLALTEPDAGTDLQGIRTRAVACGDGYRIDGAKTWISNGIEGGAVALLVKTEPGRLAAAPGHVHVHRAQGRSRHRQAPPRIPHGTEAGKARLPRHRLRRTGLRGLPA